jgi:hypothetical protein
VNKLHDYWVSLTSIASMDSKRVGTVSRAMRMRFPSQF